MWKIDTNDSTSSLPTIPSTNDTKYFSEEDSTIVPDWWLNMIQNELMEVAQYSESTPSKQSTHDVADGIIGVINNTVSEYASPYYLLYTSQLSGAVSPSEFNGHTTSGAYIIGETSYYNNKQVRLYKGSLLLSMNVYSPEGHNSMFTWAYSNNNGSCPSSNSMDRVYVYLDGALLFTHIHCGIYTTVPYYIPKGHHKLEFVIGYNGSTTPYSMFFGAYNGSTCFPSHKPIWNIHDKVWQYPKLMY